MVLMLMGILFQVPVGILAITRVGIVTPTQLRQNRRYAILVIAVLAMLLPGQDPVTMLLMMAPLIVLFEGSILLHRCSTAAPHGPAPARKPSWRATTTASCRPTPTPIAKTEPCCSTSEAPAGARPSRSST